MAKRVLVVDDDENIRLVAQDVLEDDGHEVRTAPDGSVALEVLAEWTPDVVLLDMRMPVMDGWEFARRYRDLPGPHAAIIAVTAAQDAGGWAADIAADGLLAKPFDIDQLSLIVSQQGHG